MSVTRDLTTGYQAALERAGWAEPGSGVLRVRGRDAARWLHKLITADVEHLAVGQGVRGALLEAKGHFVADFVTLALPDSILLLTPQERAEVLASNFKRYIFRENVQLDDETAAWNLMTVVGPQSDELVEQVFHSRAPETTFHYAPAELDGETVYLIRAARAPLPATDLLIPAQVGPVVRHAFESLPSLAPDTMEVLRLEAGLPRWGVDFDSSTLALEIPDVMSIRVDQGCYIGQEVVARIVHRGHVNRHLVGLVLEGEGLPAQGAPILHEGQEVGTLTSVGRSPRRGPIALGYVRREFSEPGTPLRIGSQWPARVFPLPFPE